MTIEQINFARIRRRIIAALITLARIGGGLA